ncbi:MAG TPA: hypothetical protein VFC78_19900, partial [Tepidisphaeraceae bacterium]|nr:hypothetical protein [Tepidisphaeraceae bacterium]
DLPRTPARGQPTRSPGATGGPLLRSIDKESSKSNLSRLDNPTPPSRLAPEPSAADRAAALLEEKGVEPVVARQLAANYSFERVVDVVAAMECRLSRGKCDNPGGFIRDALVKQWQTPRAVTNARAKAETLLRAQAAQQESRAAARREQDQVTSEEARIDRLIAALDDDELTILARSVLKKYEGNAAVTAVLTRKPPRTCRLMKMEIAAML